MEKKEMKEILDLFESIYPMSEGLVNQLCDKTSEFRYEAKESVLKIGQVCNYMLYVKKGLIKGTYVDKTTKETISWFMNEGNLAISVESFYNRTLTLESIVAVEDTILFVISYDDLQEIYRKFLEFNFHGRVLTEKYYVIDHKQARFLRQLDAPQRLFEVLKMQPWLFRRVKAVDIALFLGISPETLSRIRSQFSDEINDIINRLDKDQEKDQG